ncbi:hypothetical protein CN680_22175, partial [Bacillus pseudomycoides]|uniref:hypothetical protein n=1 Tax=Bacillus pseudomycoides TaxID=64104 RepID=UPI000BFB0AB6
HTTSQHSSQNASFEPKSNEYIENIKKIYRFDSYKKNIKKRETALSLLCFRHLISTPAELYAT